MLPTLRNRTVLPSLVDEFFNGDFFPRFIDYEPKYTMPAVNIAEGKEEYTIEIAAPGLTKEDFKIGLENNVLTVSSEKEEKQERKDEKVMRKEFNYYSFSRSFTLPLTVESDKIKAAHKDGILQIVIPKKEEAKEKPLREIRIS